MSLSVSKKVGIIVSLSLLLSLTIMIILLLSNETSSKLNATREEVHNINSVIKKSLIFSMLQGNSDVQPFLNTIKGAKNFEEIRVIPSDFVKSGSEKLMDGQELKVLNSKKSASYLETFNNKPVFREITTITEEQGSINCHEGKVGQTMAVLSSRYSLSEMYSDSASQKIIAIILAILTIILAYFISLFIIKKKIIKDLNASINNIQKLSQGDISEVVEIKRNDEIGNLNLSLKKLQSSMSDRALLGTEFAEGNFEKEIKLLSDKDSLGKSFQTIKLSLMNVSDDADKLIDASLKGQLTFRADSDRHHGKFKEIINGINSTLDAVIEPINESKIILGEITRGNLSARVKGNYKGDHQIMKTSINKLGNTLEKIIRDINEAVKTLANVSYEISSKSQQMAAGAQEQSLQTQEVAAAVEQMTNTILETTKNASAASDNAKEAGTMADEGGTVVNKTVQGMNRIAEVVSKASETVKKLGESSNQIGEIIKVIEEIADQTNLLALNAAIEAARAGKQGRGFAVVADEVRKLAEKTTKATKEITEMITQIQRDTGGALEAIGIGSNEVLSGKNLSAKAGESLNKIIEATIKVTDVVGAVATASEEQSSAAEQISKNIEGISSITHQSAISSRQVASASEDLNDLTLNFQNLVKQFKLNEKNEIERNLPIAEKMQEELIRV